MTGEHDNIFRIVWLYRLVSDCIPWNIANLSNGTANALTLYLCLDKWDLSPLTGHCWSIFHLCMKPFLNSSVSTLSNIYFCDRSANVHVHSFLSDFFVLFVVFIPVWHKNHILCVRWLQKLKNSMFQPEFNVEEKSCKIWANWLSHSFLFRVVLESLIQTLLAFNLRSYNFRSVDTEHQFHGALA